MEIDAKTMRLKEKNIPIIVTMGMLIFLMVFTGCVPGNQPRTFSWSADQESVQAVHAEISMGFGKLRVSEGASTLLEYDFISGVENGEPELQYQVKDDTALLVVDLLKDRLLRDSVREFDLRVRAGIPVNLKINLGLGEADLDLRGLFLTGLEVLTAGGSAEIDLTGNWSRGFNTRIVNGAGTTTLHLPSEMGVLIHIKGGMEVQAPGFIRADSTYANNALKNAEELLEVTVEGGRGKVNLVLEGVGDRSVASPANCEVVPVYTRLAGFNVPETSGERLQLTKAFFQDSQLGYGFDRGFGFGRGQVDFTSWEVKRGVLRMDNGSSWWRAANGQLLGDMLEARYLFESGLDACAGSNEAVELWLQYFQTPQSHSWYEAHNASIASAYESFDELALNEGFPERIVMANTLYRVTLADYMVTASNPVIPLVSDPRGSSVGLVTSVDKFYPRSYPLSPEDSKNAALLYLVESNPIEYAGVDKQSVMDYLISLGMSQEEIGTIVSSDANLYADLFPGFRAPENVVGPR